MLYKQNIEQRNNFKKYIQYSLYISKILIKNMLFIIYTQMKLERKVKG